MGRGRKKFKITKQQVTIGSLLIIPILCFGLYRMKSQAVSLLIPDGYAAPKKMSDVTWSEKADKADWVSYIELKMTEAEASKKTPQVKAPPKKKSRAATRVKLKKKKVWIPDLRFRRRPVARR